MPTHIEYAVRTYHGTQVSEAWRRFSEFLKLHVVCATPLQLAPFPAAKLVRHTPAALTRRRARLQLFLEDLVRRGEMEAAMQSVKPELERFFGFAPASGSDVLASGFLVKRGSTFPHTWRRRHCTLRADGTLLYFETQEAVARGARPKGTVIVVGARKLGEEHGLAFLLRNHTEMLTRCPSAEEQARWFAAAARTDGLDGLAESSRDHDDEMDVVFEVRRMHASSNLVLRIARCLLLRAASVPHMMARAASHRNLHLTPRPCIHYTGG